MAPWKRRLLERGKAGALLRLLLLSAGAVLLSPFWSGACSGPSRTPRVAAPGETTLAVMTYNLNYALAGDEATLRAIEKQRAELVLLQETTADWEDVLRERFAGRYPHMEFRHCCLAGGLGILSEQAFESLDYIEPPEGGWFPAWRLRVASPLGPLQVLNVHLHPQLGESGANLSGVLSGMLTTPSVRRAEIGHYVRYLEPGVPTLVAGDFNEAEDGGALRQLEQRGFRSALPDFSEADTWRWHTSLGTVTRRFDHIAYSSDLDVLAARVVRAGRSDHLPVLAVIARRP